MKIKVKEQMISRWETRATRSALMMKYILLICSNKRSRMPSRGLTALETTGGSILGLEGAGEGDGRGCGGRGEAMVILLRKMCFIYWGEDQGGRNDGYHYSGLYSQA